MSKYLVDNSAWARYILNDPAVRKRFRRIEDTPSDQFVTCPPQVLEFCYSAPSDKYDEYRVLISLGFPLELHPEEDFVLDLQGTLWKSGKFRAAGSIDILIAAYAILNDAIVLSCDHDFSHIAEVSDLQQEYISPTNPL